MKATIYHNPQCSNSRGALARLQAHGADIEVIDYLATPPDANTLRALIAEAGLTPIDAIRSKEAEFDALGLADADPDTLIAAMASHPRLLNRPFVRTELGTRLCRPPERVEEILPQAT
jgi:arsenate reductase